MGIEVKRRSRSSPIDPLKPGRAPRPRPWFVTAILVTAVAALPGVTTAFPGELDGTFSGDGVRRVDFGDAENAQGLAIASDDSIVVVGGAAGDITVASLRANGRFDTRFSGDGRRTIDLSGDDDAGGAARQGDKLLVAGSVDDTAAVFRLTRRGGFDRGFSRDGRTVLSLDGSDISHFDAVKPMPDGGSVAVGYSFGSDDRLDAIVARYTSSGRLDRRFSGDGIRLIARSDDVQALDVVVRPDGTLLVLLLGAEDGVIRLKTNGATDQTYGGGDGIADLPGDWEPIALARDGSRTIVVATNEASELVHVMKLSTGGLPTSFGGGDGMVTLDTGTTWACSVASSGAPWSWPYRRC